MTKEEVIENLVRLPDQIYAAEMKYLEILNRLEELRFQIKMAEAKLLSAEYSVITGKNAEIREAQLFRHTGPDRVIALNIEMELARQRAELDRLRNHLQVFVTLGGCIV